MKKITLATMGLCMLTITSCGTSQGNGALIGTGAGAALGAIVGKIAGNTAVGAAIGGAVGAGTGAIIGRHMDKVKAEAAAKVQNAKVEESVRPEQVYTACCSKEGFGQLCYCLEEQHRLSCRYPRIYRRYWW